MKKLVSYVLLFILIFSVTFTVNAQDYETNTLIPVDTVATVSTDKFDYQNFTYNSAVDGKGNTFISFGTIQNNKMTTEAVSVNILLFGEDQKNIGFLTYCSTKDVNIDEFKLKGNQAAPFSITVTSKYLVGGKSPSDVKFIAIMNENKYCQIGGYDKYKNLTIDQIKSGKGEEEEKKEEKFDITKYFKDIKIPPIAIYIAIGVFSFILVGSIINSLHKKMYARNNPLVYVPIINFYIAVKLAFGSIVALIYGVVLIISGILYYLEIQVLLYVALVILGIALVIDIIKLITKNYDMLYFEPAIKTTTFQLDNNSTKEKKEKKEKNSFVPMEDTTVPESQQALDLSYDYVDDNEVEYNVGSSDLNTNNTVNTTNNITNSNTTNTNTDSLLELDDDDDDSKDDDFGFGDDE